MIFMNVVKTTEMDRKSLCHDEPGHNGTNSVETVDLIAIVVKEKQKINPCMVTDTRKYPLGGGG